MNSWALYYNKSMMKAAGISSPPTTLAQLYADQAKEWKISGNKISQIGFYPNYNQGFEYFGSFFGAVNCFNSTGQYNLAGCPGAQTEANFFAQYDSTRTPDVAALETAYGAVAGGDDDAFVAGKEGFDMDGPWEGAQNIPVTNPAMVGNFGVVAFPGTVAGPSTFGQGNYNIIPKGASDPAAAFTFIAWLAGYNNTTFNSQIDPKGGWMPASPAIVAAARLPGVAQGQPVAAGVRRARCRASTRSRPSSPRPSRSSRRPRRRRPRTSPRRPRHRSRRWPTSTRRPTAAPAANGRPPERTTVVKDEVGVGMTNALTLRASQRAGSQGQGAATSRWRAMAADQARAAVRQPVDHRVLRCSTSTRSSRPSTTASPRFTGVGNPAFTGLRELRRPVHDAMFRTALFNTFYYTIIEVPLSTVAALGLALLLNMNVRGQAVYRTLFYIPSIVPVVASSLIFVWIFQPSFGIVNSLLSGAPRQRARPGSSRSPGRSRRSSCSACGGSASRW